MRKCLPMPSVNVNYGVLYLKSV